MPKLDLLIGGIQRLRERRCLIKVDGKPLAAICTEAIARYRGTKEDVEGLKTRLLRRHGLPANSFGPKAEPAAPLRFLTNEVSS